MTGRERGNEFMSDVAEKNSNTSKTAWMADRLILRNYKRCRDIDLKLGPLTVLFGPNTGGKSTLLEAIDFFARCTRDGVRHALSVFSQGLAVPSQGAEQNRVEFELFCEDVSLATSCESRSGRGLGFFHAETRHNGVALARWNQEAGKIERDIAGTWVVFDSREHDQPHRLFSHDGPDSREACVAPLWSLVNFVHRLKCVDVNRRDLRFAGSESGPDLELRSDGANLWSILRDLPQSGSEGEVCFERIIDYTRRAFPAFDKFRFPTTAPTRVYANVVEKGLSEAYPVLHAADGLVQFVLVVTALLAPRETDGHPDGHRVCLLDEPELSLHPWAQFVLAEAIRDVTSEGLCQVLLATHSPVLLDELPIESLFLAMPEGSETKIRPLTEAEDPKHLLSQYSAGSLYLAQAFGEQSPEPMVIWEKTDGQ